MGRPFNEEATDGVGGLSFKEIFFFPPPPGVTFESRVSPYLPQGAPLEPSLSFGILFRWVINVVVEEEEEEDDCLPTPLFSNLYPNRDGWGGRFALSVSPSLSLSLSPL